MCNYRQIDIIKADLSEFRSKIGDSSYTEEQKLAFSKISGELSRELRNERTRLYQRRKAIEKKMAKQQQLEA